MAVRIRLTRMGAKGQPFYRIVASDSRRPRDGQYLELVGTYNPVSKEVKVNEEVAMKWLKIGAQPTDTVKSMFKQLGINAKAKANK